MGGGEAWCGSQWGAGVGWRVCISHNRAARFPTRRHDWRGTRVACKTPIESWCECTPSEVRRRSQGTIDEEKTIEWQARPVREQNMIAWFPQCQCVVSPIWMEIPSEGPWFLRLCTLNNKHSILHIDKWGSWAMPHLLVGLKVSKIMALVIPSLARVFLGVSSCVHQGSRTWRTFSDPELTQNHFLWKRRLRFSWPSRQMP